MITISKPFLTDYRSHTWYENAFTPDECNYICNLNGSWQDSLTQGRTEKDENVRNSKQLWLQPTQETIWIWERFKHFIEQANSYIWKMDLENFMEHMQLTKYGEQGHYDWHIDTGNDRSSHRKISCVLNLTNHKEYKGGGTLIKVGRKAELLPMDQGTLNIFPSYVLHKAKQIKKGTRMSLVCWVGGSHYR